MPQPLPIEHVAGQLPHEHEQFYIGSPMEQNQGRAQGFPIPMQGVQPAGGCGRVLASAFGTPFTRDQKNFAKNRQDPHEHRNEHLKICNYTPTPSKVDVGANAQLAAAAAAFGGAANAQMQQRNSFSAGLPPGLTNPNVEHGSNYIQTQTVAGHMTHAQACAVVDQMGEQSLSLLIQQQKDRKHAHAAAVASQKTSASAVMNTSMYSAGSATFEASPEGKQAAPGLTLDMAGEAEHQAEGVVDKAQMNLNGNVEHADLTLQQQLTLQQLQSAQHVRTTSATSGVVFSGPMGNSVSDKDGNKDIWTNGTMATAASTGTHLQEKMIAKGIAPTRLQVVEESVNMQMHPSPPPRPSAIKSDVVNLELDIEQALKHDLSAQKSLRNSGNSNFPPSAQKSLRSSGITDSSQQHDSDMRAFFQQHVSPDKQAIAIANANGLLCSGANGVLNGSCNNLAALANQAMDQAQGRSTGSGNVDSAKANVVSPNSNVSPGGFAVDGVFDTTNVDATELARRQQLLQSGRHFGDLQNTVVEGGSADAARV